MSGVSRVLQACEAGDIPLSQVMSQLIEEAARVPPDDIARQLPLDLLDELRRRTTSPPQSPDEILVVMSICNGADFDAQEFCRKTRQLTFDGLWAWHRYFLGGTIG